MVLKRVIGLVFAGALAFSAMAGEIVVRIAPPRMVIERRGPPPSRNHVWIQGYHNWDGNITCGSREGGNSHRGRMPGG